MIPEIRSDKELFEFIRHEEKKSSIDPNISLKEIFSQYSFISIDIDEVLEKMQKRKDILLIDARSENEFNETSLPFAQNFPVLNNIERHNVGLLYKKYSQSSAIWLAKGYADTKNSSLKDFLISSRADEKEIIVFCWRGGGRSKYLSKMIIDAGYKVKFLSGGQKAYRKEVNRFFSNENQNFKFIEITGKTGSGKTEILNLLKNDLPVIDLEFAAKHYSSLFGNIPYDINNFPRVKNQSAFENSLFEQFAKYDLNNLPVFLIESESKRVGDFEIPANIFKALEKAPCLELICSTDNRTKRIVKDYFGDDSRGLEPMKDIFSGREKFFKAQLSNEVYARLLSYLKSGEVSKFTAEMMELYYDKRYKIKSKEPLAKINSDNPAKAQNEILKIYQNFQTRF
jgi:tRNA 2-selenouridine synthase